MYLMVQIANSTNTGGYPSLPNLQNSLFKFQWDKPKVYRQPVHHSIEKGKDLRRLE
jgi:hypothetical protein